MRLCVDCSRNIETKPVGYTRCSACELKNQRLGRGKADNECLDCPAEVEEWYHSRCWACSAEYNRKRAAKRAGQVPTPSTSPVARNPLPVPTVPPPRTKESVAATQKSSIISAFKGSTPNPLSQLAYDALVKSYTLLGDWPQEPAEHENPYEWIVGALKYKIVTRQDADHFLRAVMQVNREEELY